MRRYLLFFVAFINICLLSCAQEVSEPLFPCAKKIDKPYGVSAHLTLLGRDFPTRNEQIKLMKEAGMDNIRCDLWVPYNEMWEENELLSALDTVVNTTQDENMDLLGILFVGWKNQRAWERKSLYFSFLDYLISKYKTSIPYWEVMNEVNLTSKDDEIPMETTISYYMSLLPMTYRKLKLANPNLIVTSSGLGDVNDDFLELMCKRKSYDYFDVLNIHTYDAPEEMPDKLRKIRGLMDKYKWSKPLWITESGMPTNYDKIVKPLSLPNEQRETEQAYRIPRMYIISFAYGVDKVFTFKLRAEEKDRFYTEDHFGIVHSDLTPKPAYIAYQTLTKMLPSGSSRPTLTKDGNTYYSYWKRPDKKKVWALWCSHGEKQVKLKIKGKADFYDYLGNRISVSEDIEIGKGVIFVVGAKSVGIVSSVN